MIAKNYIQAAAGKSMTFKRGKQLADWISGLVKENHWLTGFVDLVAPSDSKKRILTNLSLESPHRLSSRFSPFDKY